MESRFSYLRQPDSSVSMLRIKMSRRRSQSQKENRDRALTRLRRLDKLPELDASALDVSAVGQVAVCRQETVPTKKQGRDLNAAVEERRKMLTRYKEAKELQKEKEKRERERKGGVFKVGLYKPQALASLSQVSSAPSRAKPLVPASVPVLSSRVTRSMKQQPVQKIALPVMQKAVPRKVEPAVVKPPASRVNKPTVPSSGRGKAAAVEAAVRTPATRSASDSQTSAQAALQKPAGPTTRSSSKQHMEPPKGRAKPVQGKTKMQTKEQKAAVQDEREKSEAASSHPPAGPTRGARADEPPDPPSFAPQGFVFHAPAGLKPFQCAPLTPRSADAFLTPSAAPPPFSFLSPGVSRPSVKPASPRPPSPPPLRRTPSPPAGPQEAQHDVPYFRAIMASETGRLSGLCEQWEARTEDSSIPEEVRDGMRTAIGQARLLMKERFSQFEGLVDDCALGRGEKITTCSDLQGFWDMVYFQVEDVMKKFDGLKAAECRGWQDEPKSRPRPKRAVKKAAQTAPASKSVGESGASAAAKSRLAAVKAAMRARRAAVAESAEPAADAPAGEAVPPEPLAPAVVFHGGFFKVESPAKLPGPLRRSARLSAAASPAPASTFTTPARSRRSDAVKPSPVCQRLLTLSPPASTPPCRTPHSLSQSTLPQGNTPSVFRSPSGHVTQEGSPKNGCPAFQEGSDSKKSGFSDDHLESDLADAPLQSPESPRLGSPLPAESETGVEPPQVEEVQGLVAETETGDQAGLAVEVGCPLAHLSTKNLEQNSSFLHSPSRKPNSPLASAHGLSFTLSPTPYESAPVDTGLTALSELSLSPPQPTSSAAPDSTQHPPSPAVDMDMSSTPDSSYVEYITGLDFERYLRPPIRSSLSPRRPASAQASPMAVDVNAGSPEPQPGEWPVGGALNHMGPSGELRALGPALVQPAEPPGSSLLLFTPEQKAKVRQSVCGRDLMMFTPPSSS
ncbi:disks large-associated protein 5 isoform X2 [Brienomyrus brachyistius]|uniref:disks large-associated protein 5 isoform X2 n=1 Tax=Brienomyrus brachyistius TaxID=42636 RepID=UPI0020B1C0E1|nr:disks large-associated protein 5 isoform X2 [Brienomyrus brachyistius]